MANTPIDYTQRDFATIKEALRNHLATKFPTTWKDFADSGLGMALIELIAYTYDVLSFYLDYQANETYLATARDRENVLKLCGLLGYKVRTATGAAATCRLQIASVQTEAVVVPAHQTVMSFNKKTFSNLVEYTIPIGATQLDTAVFVEGVPVVNNFSGSGDNFYKIQLPNAGVVFNSIQVSVDDVVWDEVDSLVYGGEDSKIYTVEYDNEDRAYVQFGDNVSGQRPSLGAEIVVRYRTGGGLAGNVPTGTITGTISGSLEISGDPIVVNVTNLSPAAGGEERESSEHAKLWAPRWVKTNGRAVTLEDFKTLANAWVDETTGSTFTCANARLHQEVPELNLVDILVWSRNNDGDPIAPPSELKDALRDYFMNNGPGAVRIICTDVDIVDGEVRYVDVSAVVKVASSFTSSAVLAEVTSAINALFPSDNWQPGETFRLSRLYRAIQNVNGVEYATIRNIRLLKEQVQTFALAGGVGAGDLSALNPGLPIAPFSIRMENADAVVTDDGQGTLLQSNVAVGTVNYVDGTFSMTITSAESSIEATCRQLTSWVRNEEVGVGDGSAATMSGTLSYVPIVPRTDGEKGVTVSIDSSVEGYDGMVLSDNGAGLLLGDGGSGTINYATGAFTITWNSIIGSGVKAVANYHHIQSGATHDLMVNDDEVAVKGQVTISTN